MGKEGMLKMKDLIKKIWKILFKKKLNFIKNFLIFLKNFLKNF